MAAGSIQRMAADGTRRLDIVLFDTTFVGQMVTCVCRYFTSRWLARAN